MTIMERDSASTPQISRPQVGIDRLQVKKPVMEQKEAMNCKSCRKRKIKCNRLRPSCEACQVFNCACIYDAIPKKRGPKTDVLEALLKRVNGLEKRLKDEQKSTSPDDGKSASSAEEETETKPQIITEQQFVQPTMAPAEPGFPELQQTRSAPVPIRPAPPPREALAFTDALLDTYFARVHNKPYYILDETATRQRLRDGRLPRPLVNAIHAVSIRYLPQLCGGLHGAIRSSQDYALQSRIEIDVDEPNIDNLQALLLLAMANQQNGKGKRCYMILTHAISMALALNLHRELPTEIRISTSEREGRRKLFWSCYLMDRFTVAGSKRPSLISDESIHLRLPGSIPHGSQSLVDGAYFPNGSSAMVAAGSASAGQASSGMLVEIVRVLGMTNRYLAAGGVKGDSHFPWHAHSTLSKIRQDLDYWAANTQEIFTSIGTLFGSPESSTLVLSKLIYHLIHCLIYRPFLPVDLTELSGTGQNQSWQIEATNFCFLHANAIAELVEIGKNTGLLDWPSFVGYCICTAGTIHVHGAHYVSNRDSDAFCHSAEFLSREMAQLLELSSLWASIQHQRSTLQTVYVNHGQLVKSLASNPMRFSPVFQMEDFFDRYPGSYIDGAHVTFSDVAPETPAENISAFDFATQPADPWSAQTAPEQYPSALPAQQQAFHYPTVERPGKKRRLTTSSLPYPTSKPDMSNNHVQHTIEEEQHPIESMPHPVQHHDPHHLAEMPEHDPTPMLFQGAFSPNFGFSPIQTKSQPANEYDPSFNPHAYGGRNTPSRLSGSTETYGEVNDLGDGDGMNDPFLSLLEQLANGDANGLGGQDQYDLFLGANA